MSLSDLGASAAASGWRAKVTGAVARRLDSSPVPLNERQVRTALGFGFLALSVRHVAEDVPALPGSARGYDAGSGAGVSSSAGSLVSGSAMAAPTR